MEPFIGEIRISSIPYAPKGWAFCHGQLLSINQNQALFSLMGTTYGGNGQTSFALPDLRGRCPISYGSGAGEYYSLGQIGGEFEHRLSIAELPSHNHGLAVSSALATSGAPAGALPGKKGRLGRDLFAAPANLVGLNQQALSQAGSGQAHTNMQPFLVLNFIIALQGVFPSRN
ncbi:phage tail protein [Rugamonas rubra]|uniref:Microcystin-dependent protein n=1 Tax=Rugamonas rubra TaxID=758825 RepID=A0A1I4KG51_9BURK|nr:tail fiber protein [Rugamonas rubra]SFL77755.1 Microcystin-dependent protein [Rugamonas rubra]